MQYIFGYGSLIDTRSRQRTTPRAHMAYPAIITDLARGWWLHGVQGWDITWLAVQFEVGSHCNGVIYAVDDRELQHTDWRERGYKRLQIPAESITMLVGDAPDGPVWTYTTATRERPQADFPIWQSYVDMCMRGCMEVEAMYANAAGFTADFVRSTHDWSGHWRNNRKGRTDMPIGAIRRALYASLPGGVNPPI